MSVLSIDDLPPPPAGLSGWPWTEASPSSRSGRAGTGNTSEIGSQGEGEWPRISVVTPNYNYAQFLEATIRTVLLHGYSNLECV